MRAHRCPASTPCLGPFSCQDPLAREIRWVAQPTLFLWKNTSLSSVHWFSASLSWAGTFAEHSPPWVSDGADRSLEGHVC